MRGTPEKAAATPTRSRPAPAAAPKSPSSGGTHPAQLMADRSSRTGRTETVQRRVDGHHPGPLQRRGPELDGKPLTPIGKGSSHKQVFSIAGDEAHCFVAIRTSEKSDLEAELKNYSLLASRKVRVPAVDSTLHTIEVEGESWTGVRMERLRGVEYKQRLTWAFVKRQVLAWPEEGRAARIRNLLETIDLFLKSGVFVTDLQVFILDDSGEMVVFDPSTAAITQTPPANTELKDIHAKLTAMV